MANLVYYKKERADAFIQEVCAKHLTPEEARIVLKKIKKHYKMDRLGFSINNRKRGGACYHQSFDLIGGWIEVSQPINMGTLCHEFAHALHHKKYPNAKSDHNKKHWKLMKGVMAYCKKKNYWQEELQKRLAPTPLKPEPTKEELKLAKIERTKTNLKKANSKLKFWSNKVRKYQKRIRLMERKAILSVSVDTPTAEACGIAHSKPRSSAACAFSHNS